MKIAFLFVGQGSQIVGMGHDVYNNYNSAKQLFDSVQLEFDVKEMCFKGPQELLVQTQYTQPSLLVTSLAIAYALNEEGIRADTVAGLSLGEYSALCYAKCLSVENALNLVSKRAQIMANALPNKMSGMVAVLSDKLDLIKDVVLKTNETTNSVIEIANYNSPSQTVISGVNQALEKAVNELNALKIRCIPLAVSGAFHTSLLKEASNQLWLELSKTEIAQPACTMLFNVSGKEELDIKSALTNQICSSVQWVKTIQRMKECGIDCFIEIGPKNSIQKLVKQILPDAKVYSVDSKESIKHLLGEING